MGGSDDLTSPPPEDQQESILNDPEAFVKYIDGELPVYMAMGMTPEEYWNGDPALLKAYRKADEIRRERDNEMLWLQGMYIYEAIGDLAPVLHAFAKKGAEAKPYSDRPYPITKRLRAEAEEIEKKREYERQKAQFTQLMASVNMRFASKGG